MREWLRVGWHVGGMDFDRYLALSMFERIVLHDELSELIETANPAPKKESR